jgi:hypothetical protein
LFLAGGLLAGEKKVMHCFYFTAAEGATPADWESFYKATDSLPVRIPGVSRVWYGKLRRDLSLVTLEPGEKAVPSNAVPEVRQYGVCMEMKNLGTLNLVYGDHAAHRQWEKAYAKVRKPGTTTADIVGR